MTASGAGQLTITGSLNVTLGALTILHGRPDSSSIDAAIVAALRADATLAGLLPDGVYFDVAPAQAKRFVLVSLIDEHDEATFSKGRTYEDALYLVKGVALSTLAVNMRTVAARIDAVLEDVELVATGFTFMDSCREARVRLTEIDDLDTSIQWHHRGGHYRVRMALE